MLQRIEHDLDQDGQDDDGEPVVARELVDGDQAHQQESRDDAEHPELEGLFETVLIEGVGLLRAKEGGAADHAIGSGVDGRVELATKVVFRAGRNIDRVKHSDRWLLGAESREEVIVLDADVLHGPEKAGLIGLFAMHDLEAVVALHNTVSGDDELTVLLFAVEGADAGADGYAVGARRADGDGVAEEILSRNAERLGHRKRAVRESILEDPVATLGSIAHLIERAVRFSGDVRVGGLDGEREVRSAGVARLDQLDLVAVLRVIVLEPERDQLGAVVREARHEIGRVDGRLDQS